MSMGRRDNRWLQLTTLPVIIALACFIVSLFWPIPNSKIYIPGIVLFLKSIMALVYLSFGLFADGLVDAIIRFMRILFGAVIPNIIMFIIVYRLIVGKWIGYRYSIILYVCFFIVAGAIGWPIFYDNHLNKTHTALETIQNLGGIVLWTASFLLMAVAMTISNRSARKNRISG